MRNTSTVFISLAGLAALACTSCVMPHARPERGPTETSISSSVSPATESVLYARDGTPVTGGSQGAARVDAEPRREFGDGEGNRASLLELYTAVVAEKSAFAEEIVALRATLEQERKEAAAGADARAVLRGELDQVTRERDALKAETLDLAARLTTAQIARLEAQKALLQLQIEARMREDAAAAVHSASKDKDKKRSGGEHK